MPAKRFGIRTGEPVASALKKCPFLVIEPPAHDLYRKRSAELMALLHTYTSDIEQASVDECYLDYTPIQRQFASPEAAARLIADRVRDTLGFTVNIGIAPNKLLAKMASDFEKPDRVHTLYPEEIPEKMWPLPVGELFMVGKSSAERLNGFGIRTIGDLAHADPEFLQLHFKSHAKSMWEHANGLDDTPVNPNHPEAKGIGNSKTMSEDLETAQEARHELLQLAEKVAARLRKEHLAAQSVTVEIKYNTFRSCSRQTQTERPVFTSAMLYDCACQLFDELWDGTPIRLLGVRTTKLTEENVPVQLTLFDPEFGLTADESVPDGIGEKIRPPVPASVRTESAYVQNPEKQRRLEAAMDQIRQKYGKDAVTRGSLMNNRKEKREQTSGSN
ncbi:MAG: DNA polymerase IV [Lachnospiraceae bacterium]|nr:DNA polymerase IV [Lachnospiraceae bacterium]